MSGAAIEWDAIVTVLAFVIARAAQAISNPLAVCVDLNRANALSLVGIANCPWGSPIVVRIVRQSVLPIQAVVGTFLPGTRASRPRARRDVHAAGDTRYLCISNSKRDVLPRATQPPTPQQQHATPCCRL